jgi:hypothetical protein
MTAFKIYRFNTVDEAIQCMMLDTESGKYLHRFIPYPEGICGICSGTKTEHLEYSEKDSDLTTINESNLSDITVEKSAQKKNNINNVHVNIPKSTLNAFDDPNICRICFDNTLSTTNKIALDCGHEFCTPCVLGYLKININNGKVFC